MRELLTGMMALITFAFTYVLVDSGTDLYPSTAVAITVLILFLGVCTAWMAYRDLKNNGRIS